nr:Chain C, VP3 [Coxsackievirus A7]4BIQ_C Chain C, VP3 [Coxsackievirus A7]
RNLLELCQIDTIMEVNNLTTNEATPMERLRIPVQVQTQSGELCAAFKADPGLDGPWQSTMVGQLCRYYTQWSGSLKITFMFTGSFMATGKMLIAYTPPGGSLPANRMQAMLGTHVIWDFGLQSSVTLVVPWISNTHYRSQATGSFFDYYATGIVSLWYQTNFVVPIGAPTTAYIVVLGSAQKNFTMRLCRDTSELTQAAEYQ